MRKILTIILTFCTVFSSVCTIVLAQEQSSLVGTVSGNDAVAGMVSEDTNVTEPDGGVVEEAVPDEIVSGNMSMEDAPYEGISSKDGGWESEGVKRYDIENGYFYYAKNDKGINISLVYLSLPDGSDFGEIRIPDRIEDTQVYRIGDSAFGTNLWKYTGSVILPESITEVGNNAFYGCSNIAITFPAGLKEIGDAAFYDCKRLTGNLVLEDLDSTKIGNNVFQNCSGLTGNLTLPAGITEVGNRAFSGCSGLTGELRLEGVTAIGEYAFYGCSGFTGELQLSQSMTSISKGAFWSCSGLSEDLKLPNSITQIGDNAFSECSGLNGTLILPENLETIGQGVFFDCKGLCGELKLPEGLKEIGDYAFSGMEGKADGFVWARGCGFTGDLVIPNGVKIGAGAFDGCKDFSGILKLPDDLTELGNGAFHGCSGFTGELKLPEGLTEISDSAFYNCSGFTGRLNLPKGLIEIGENAFRGCSGFTGDLVIPDSVQSIKAGAFQYCSSLSRDIYMTANVSSIMNDLLNESAFQRSYDQNTGERITVADIMIHAPRGSYAETYAIENGYSYTDDNGYVHKGTGTNNVQKPGTDDKTDNEGDNTDNKDDNRDDGEEDENNTHEDPSVAIINTTTLQIQVTTKPSDADKAAGIKDGEHLQIEVYGSEDDNVLKALNKAAADMGATIAAVFNIDLKVLGANGNLIRKVSEPGSALTFTIPAPAGVDGNVYDFAVLRYHNGQIDVLPDLDSDPATITFASNRFSVYAVVYGAKGSFSGRQTIRDGVPRTGDRLPIAVPATATVIFAVLSCILGRQELLEKRAKRMRNR